MKIFKTLFLIIVISLITITVNATTVDTTSKPTVVTDSTLTFLKVYEDVKGGILGLAEALKTPAEHVYEVLVKQQVVNAWSGLLLIIITIIIMVLSYKLLINKNNYIIDKDGIIKELKAKSVIGIILAVLSISTMIISIIDINNILTGFFNPEYGAMKNIVDFIK